jgi:hypothetical protein
LSCARYGGQFESERGVLFEMMTIIMDLMRQGSGIENTKLVGQKSYQITNHGRSYIYRYDLYILRININLTKVQTYIKYI